MSKATKNAPEPQREIDPRLAARVAARLRLIERPRIPLEWLLTSEEGFALTTATPVQRAFCRIADGIPLGDLAEDEQVKEALGLPLGEPTPASVCTLGMPKELFLIAAIRSGKSLIAAALALRAALTCDLDHLGPGEIARVSIVSIQKDLAQVALGHVVGRAAASPWLSKFIVGEPTADRVVIRHPTGRLVEIMVAAGSRAGSTLVARWSAGAIFDEAPRMMGADDGVINFDEARRAVLGRLLPGAQLFALGSPWAPFGPVYTAVKEHFGKPSTDTVIFRGTGPMLNPYWWTKARCEELAAKDWQAYLSDVLGQFRDLDTQLFPQALIQSCTRKEPLILPHDPTRTTYFAMDPATRGNTWSLVAARRKTPQLGKAGGVEIVGVWEWTPTPQAPLKPSAVLFEIAKVMAQYDARILFTDQWSADTIADLALQIGIVIDDRAWTMERKVDAFDSVQLLMKQGALDLPPHPPLYEDLLAVQKKIMLTNYRIELLRVGGRHADDAIALALAVSQIDFVTLGVAGGPREFDARQGAPGDAFAGQPTISEQARKRSETYATERNPATVTMAHVRAALTKGGF